MSFLNLLTFLFGHHFGHFFHSCFNPSINADWKYTHLPLSPVAAVRLQLVLVENMGRCSSKWRPVDSDNRAVQLVHMTVQQLFFTLDKLNAYEGEFAAKTAV